MSPWPLFNMYMDSAMRKVKLRMGKMEVRFSEKGREWRLPNFLYIDVLVLYDDTEEDLKMMVGHFVEVRKGTWKSVQIRGR